LAAALARGFTLAFDFDFAFVAPVFRLAGAAVAFGLHYILEHLRENLICVRARL
jgi:hypothetical protein